jgi:hypothetical protein
MGLRIFSENSAAPSDPSIADFLSLNHTRFKHLFGEKDAQTRVRDDRNL